MIRDFKPPRKRLKIYASDPAGSSRQKYQKKLNHKTKNKRQTRFLISGTIFLLLLTASICGLVAGVGTSPESKQELFAKEPAPGVNQPAAQEFELLTKTEIRSVFGHQPIPIPTRNRFTLIHNGQTYTVHTSIDMELQNFISTKLDRRTSQRIGIVVIEPSTGRILAMSGHDKSRSLKNPCIDSRFPAASIFKIITAAAAIEKYGFKPSTTFTYSGGKHTLYRSQLKEQKNRYTRRISFRDSFAQSVNPVFGKLGVHFLDISDLEKYARLFGFNQEIPFDYSLTPSAFVLTEDPYGRAEIASGFNRKTTLSPLHGALIASAICNRGSIVEPSLIDEIADDKGNVLYQRENVKMGQAVSPETARVIAQLMEATIRSGTSRKAFRGYLRDKTLSNLVIGGKTGSISNDSNEVKYDWFVGFAGRKNLARTIAISILVAHDGYIGKKASSYARMTITTYFKNSVEKGLAHTEDRRPS
ncbi:MAG: penicillin-binding transpeptidase domain-containing protein [Thermodesulfobacteriota bacterium]